jgi:hypothetical protein
MSKNKLWLLISQPSTLQRYEWFYSFILFTKKKTRISSGLIFFHM